MYTFEVYSSSTYKTATSYISVQEMKDINDFDIFVNYIDIGTELDEDIEMNLMKASYYLDVLFPYNESKQNEDQNLEFPRTSDDLYELNRNIKTATAYLAAQVKTGDLSTLFVDFEGTGFKKQKVDVLEVERFAPVTRAEKVFSSHPYLEKLLKPYFSAGIIIPLNKG